MEKENKKELLSNLRNLIKDIQQDKFDFEVKETIFNLERGKGYLITNKRFHVWFIVFRKGEKKR